MADNDNDEKEQSEWNKLLRQGWITTSLERDKTVITLSSAGLGLIVTFITKSNAQGFIRAMLLVGLLSFAAAIFAGVRVLHLNRAILLRELKREPEEGILHSDRILIWGFVAGVVAVTLVGFSAIFHHE